MRCKLAPKISRLHGLSSCQKMLTNINFIKQKNFRSCGRLRRSADRVSTPCICITCGGATGAAYGRSLDCCIPSTCGCAAPLNRRSGLSNTATWARSCPARSWSSYCRSQTDGPRGSRWQKDLCFRPGVQPWLEPEKLCHRRHWHEPYPNCPFQIKFLADRARRQRCKSCQENTVLKKLPTCASAIPAGEVQRLRASRKWCLHASDVLIRFVVNAS